MGDEDNKVRELRLVHAVTNPVKEVKAIVNIQTPDGLRTYRIWIPVSHEGDTAEYRRIRNILGAGLELGASVLDASLEREDSD